MTKPNHYAAMLTEMEAWIAEQEAAGWQSDEVRYWAERVKYGLWACANNRELTPVMLEALAHETKELAKAKQR